MYSTYNEGKSVVAERFIKTLKNKIFKNITAISKNVYFDVLYDIVDKYNNTVHRTMKMKPIDITDDFYVKSSRIAFNKDLIKSHAAELRSVELDLCTYLISDLKVGENIGSFYEKELKKTSQKEFRIEKVLERKGDKLYIKWNEYYNSFNSWLDKKDIL